MKNGFVLELNASLQRARPSSEPALRFSNPIAHFREQGRRRTRLSTVRPLCARRGTNAVSNLQKACAQMLNVVRRQAAQRLDVERSGPRHDLAFQGLTFRRQKHMDLTAV